MGVTLMSDLQRTFVSDHIADLEREAAALRAERARDGRRPQARGADPADQFATLPARRVRLGRWLVAVGQRIAGTRPAASGTAPVAAAAIGRGDDPCDDGHDRLAPAA